MNKQELKNCLTETEDILNQNEIESDILKPRFAAQKDAIKNFSANILFVGSFSAGKSALINSFLGDEEILKENISPQTAIATELFYGDVEKVDRVRDNGEIISCNLSEVENLSVEGFRKHVYYLNRPVLKNLRDLILVDMPGFDSGIEAHNKALMQYIEDAAAYIFVIDLEKGTVGKSSLDFLQEIKQYSESIAFVLTKRDKLLPTDADKVAQNIEAVLSASLGTNPRLIVTSSRESDCGEKLGELLKNFSADELLMQKFAGKTIILLRQAVQSMQMQLSALDFNPHDLDFAIQNQERKKESVINTAKREKKKLHDNLQLEVPNKILHDVETALKNQIGTLVHSAQQGGDAFNTAISNIIRPILIQSTQQHIDATFDSYVGKIVSLSQNDPINADAVAYKMRNAVDVFGKIAEGGKMFAKMKKFKQAYQIFSTGLAVTTNLIAPWLELIVIFLPDIVGILNDLLGQSKEEKLKNHIETEIIPQICEKLRPNIREALLQVEEERFAEIDAEFQITLDSEIAALQQLKEEKERNFINVEQKKSALTAGINRIEEIIHDIEIA